jgi:FKBP-type peptidyl-prolyl cis-trans isomerase
MKQFLIFVLVAALVVIGAVMYRSRSAPVAVPIQEPGTSAPVAVAEAPGEVVINSKPKTMANGLIIEDTKVGTGAEAVSGKTVTVNYIGTFSNGKKFDASKDHGNDGFTFPLGAGRVIQGWDQGVVGMKVGGVRKLTVPPTLGYGPNDYGPIPGNSTLLFEVELLAVK